MNDKEALKLEIQSGKVLVNEYKRLREKYAKKIEAQKNKKASKFDRLLADYPTWEDAHEAWGMDYITKTEFETLEKIYNEKDIALAIPNVNEAVYETFDNLIKAETANIRDCEWELLPEEDKERIRLETAKREAERSNHEK